MNKIKFMYDVARTMKNKEKVKTKLKFQLTKNQSKVMAFEGEFEKDFSENGRLGFGRFFNGHPLHRQGHPFGGHPLHGHPFAHQCQGDEAMIGRARDIEGQERDIKRPSKMKSCFSAISIFFGLIDSADFTENQDGSVLVQLCNENISEDLKKTITEMQQARREMFRNMGAGNNNMNPMNHLKDMKEPAFSIQIKINANKEVEYFAIKAKGEKEENQIMELDHETSFVWEV